MEGPPPRADEPTMSVDPDIHRISWELGKIQKAVEKLESYKLDLLAERQADMAENLKSLRRIVVQVGVGIVSASIVFALSVFMLLGKS